MLRSHSGGSRPGEAGSEKPSSSSRGDEGLVETGEYVRGESFEQSDVDDRAWASSWAVRLAIVA